MLLSCATLGVVGEVSAARSAAAAHCVHRAALRTPRSPAPRTAHRAGLHRRPSCGTPPSNGTPPTCGPLSYSSTLPSSGTSP
eukprot:3379084-Prymnesium_polylepis.1